MIDMRQERSSKPQLAARGLFAFMFLVLLGLATAPVAQAQYTFNALYDFQGAADGSNPLGGLIEDSAGNLYGTVQITDYYSGDGGVFEVSPGGNETLLYDFCGVAGANYPCPDGSTPDSTLLMDSAGNLYGTVTIGGANNYGAVFELSPAPSGGVCPSNTNQGTGWCESVLYSFTGGNDGAYPSAVLIQDAAGNLYSTTSGGSPNNSCGSVFELSPGSGDTWTEKTLYDFTGIPSGKTSGDGCDSVAGVVLGSSGNLYGTTVGGGASHGTVYELNPNSSGPWTETILYAFAGAPADGAAPYSDLVFNGGNLYGTTEAGGSNGNLGTVFQLSPGSSGSWTETTLFNFTTATGCNPREGVTFDPQGNLCGTTSSCAIANTGSFYGTWNGSVYELKPPVSGTTWTETTLYEFQGENDGANPYGVVLRDSSGNLYGTASTCYNCTYMAGSVWSLTLPTTTTTVKSSLNPSIYGESVTFTATITSSSGQVKKSIAKNGARNKSAKPAVVGGTVTWSEDTGCGSTPVTSGYPGTATCTTTSLPIGTDAITATYAGDGGHIGSTGTLNGGQIVNAVANVGVTSTLNPSAYGQAVSFSATVTGSNPTGTVQFTIDGSAFGSPVALVSGTAVSGSISTLSVGNHSVAATYSGDANNGGSTGLLSGGQIVSDASTSLSLASSENPSHGGQAVTFTLTITAANGLVRHRNGVRPQDVTGTVAWTANGVAIPDCGAVPVSYTPGTGTGTATCLTTTLPLGGNVISATYSGDANHTGGSATLTQNVEAPLLVPAIVWNTPVAITYGTALSTRQLNAKAEYNNRTVPGTFTYTPAAGTILAAGNNQTLSVTFTPTDTNTYASASGSVELNVNPITPTMKTTETKDGLILTLGFSVTAKYGQPTGIVAVTSGTGGPTCNATLTSGAGTCTLTFSTGGTYTLTITYSGDSNDASITETRTVTVNPLHTTTRITSTSSPVTTNAPITVNFSVTASQGQPTGSVAITSNNGGPACTGTLTSGTGSCTLTFTATGTYTLTATYSGDSNDASSSVNHNVRVTAGGSE